MVTDRFEVLEYDDPDGYSGLGSGYYYIMDRNYGEIVHDEDGMMIIFDIEEGDAVAARDEADKYICEHYDELVELSDAEYGVSKE